MSNKVKTQQVDRNRGHRCEDIELSGYLTNVAGSVSLVMDLHIAHDRWGSTSNPSLTGQFHYPTDFVFSFRPLNETVADKNLQYRADYNNRPSNSISLIPAIAVVVLPDSI